MNTINAQERTQTLNDFISDGTPAVIRERYAALSAAAEAADYGEFDRNIVVLDTETTGFSLNHDELTQIAAARMEGGKIVDWYVTFVNPGKPIPEDVAHLTDIHDDDVADAPTPEEAVAGLVEFAGDAKLVAHNAEFDRNFLTKHPAGYALLENTWIDSLDLARIALPRMKSHRLIDLITAFGGPLSTHRADDDVASTCVLLRILFAAVDAMPPELVAEIARMAPAEQWSTVAVFEYFAQRHARQEQRESETDAFLEGAEELFAAAPRRARFSLRALRQERLCKVEYRAKVDADELAADPQRGLAFPEADDIADAFTATGLVGSLYPDFESRGEQATMAEAVRNAFATSTNLLVEAGTGVGKSMAYLVPAIRFAKKNDVAVGVATKTNALLDQLMFHELPALAEAVGGLRYAALKGFSHYPCLRRIGRIVEEGARMREVAGKEYSQAPALAALLSFIEQTEYDDLDGLKIDYRVLPRYSITTTSHDCLRRKCPFYGTTCFVHGARRRAEAADVVVTNHSLLFCDLAADNGLLPPIRYWVLDEAHGAETEARRAFALDLSADKLLNLATRVSAEDAARNVFLRTERRVTAPAKEGGETLFYALVSKAKAAGKTYAEAATEFAARIKDLLFFDTNKRSKGYEYVELWLNDQVRGSETFARIANCGKLMNDASEKLITACQELVGYLEDVENAAELQREIASIAIELRENLHAAEIILQKNPEQYVYSATLNRKADRAVDKLEALLVNVGDTLNEKLFANTHSVVFASATLSVNNSFEPFMQALGLNTGEHSQCNSCLLESSYDYDTHMTVYVVQDMPEPNDPAYLPALQKLLAAVHVAQRGSMLTLFTNRREMETCFNEVQPILKAADLRLVCQKWGVSTKGLRDDFLADKHLSLFALKSFWEGFDAPGSTLRGVIIPKLPFAKPTDPLSCERAARDDQAWRRYVLPAAVLETKQAAGRLIRKADDRGVLILADHRLISKSYGRAFLNSLPSCNVKTLSAAAIAAELEEMAAR